MSKLLITTQVYENYAWNEDGSLGTGDQAYWKAKGGNDYVVKNIDPNRASDIVNFCTGKVECDNEAFREYIINWEVVADDYMTEFEKSQLEYDGRISCPEPRLTIDGDLVPRERIAA